MQHKIFCVREFIKTESATAVQRAFRLLNIYKLHCEYNQMQFTSYLSLVLILNYRLTKLSPSLYTGCPKRNVPDFGRVFLMLKYTDITQNTYVQSWTVTEIKAREKFGLLAVPRTVPGSRDVIPIHCTLSVLVYSLLKRVRRCDCTCKVLGNPKDDYDMSASVFVVQFNGFMSLTS